MPSVMGRSATSLSDPTACALARALLGSGCTIRSPPSCQITDRAGRHRLRSPIPRTKLPVSAVPSCVSRAHWSRSTILMGQFTTLLDQTRESQIHRRSTMPSLGTSPLASLLDLPGSDNNKNIKHETRCADGRHHVAAGAARRRRERRYRSFWRHELMAVKMATLTVCHHSAQMKLAVTHAATQTDVTHDEVTSATGLVNPLLWRLHWSLVHFLSRKTLPHPCTTKSIRNRSLQPAPELQCSSSWHPHL